MNSNPSNSFKVIIGSQYFIYFGVLGIFLPFFNLYCYHIGFSGFQIGNISSLRSVVTILFSIVWGILADRFQARRPMYILCCIISTIAWSFFLYTSDYKTMLVIMFFYGIFYAPIISFLEAFTMDVLEKNKEYYGRIRVWGSINFILVVIIAGKIIDLYSIEVILLFILTGSLLQAIISVKMPEIKIEKKEYFTADIKVLFNKRVIIFLFCSFLMLVSHGTFYGFFSIHLENLGYGKTSIGLTWALAVIAEILVMIKSDMIFKRFSLENVLIFSFLVAFIRWAVLFFAQSFLLIIISQLFHAVTYGAFHIASILYIDLLTPDRAKTTGQSVNNAVTYGLGMMVGFFFNGYFFESLGSFNLFFISALIALTGGLIFSGFHLFVNKSVSVHRRRRL